MTTTITITGTGTPSARAHLAGAGVCIRHGDTVLQFDAGRNTTARLTAIDVEVLDLTTVFLTHYHSDHVVGLADIAVSRWITDFADEFVDTPLQIVAPNGHTMRFCERLHDIWDNDLDVRARHAGRTPDPRVELIGFDVPDAPTEVWANDEVRVLAGQVRHEPVEGAVGYRIETPDGVIVISGDTKVCPEMAELSAGADVVVYEAMRTQWVLEESPESEHFIVEYHADTVEIGEQMAELQIPTVILTHLIPHLKSAADKQPFIDEVRSGGYSGELIVAEDLETFVLEST